MRFEKCWLRDGCPGKTASCSSCQPTDNGCPVYRWFKNMFDKGGTHEERENAEETDAWRLTETDEPPRGEPLLVTVQAKWKEWREVLAPVYYVYDMSLSKFVFFNAMENGVIGPDTVKVVAWKRMPKPCEEAVIWP